MQDFQASEHQGNQVKMVPQVCQVLWGLKVPKDTMECLVLLVYLVRVEWVNLEYLEVEESLVHQAQLVKKVREGQVVSLVNQGPVVPLAQPVPKVLGDYLVR